MTQLDTGGRPAVRGVSLRGIWRSHRELRPYVLPTPLYRADLVSRALGGDVWLKVETTAPAACFTWRGALTALLRAGGANGVRGAVTASMGSHGRGLAQAADRLGVAAHVVVPEAGDAELSTLTAMLGACSHRRGSWRWGPR